MKNSKILKILSYILIPFLVLLVAISIFYQIGKQEYYNETSADYFNSSKYLENYMSILSSRTRYLIYENGTFKSVFDNDKEIFYYNDRNLEYSDFYYLIEYKNILITNVELSIDTNTIEGIKNYIGQQEGIKTIVQDGKIESSSEIIKNKGLNYFDYFNIKYYTSDVNIQGSKSHEIIVQNRDEYDMVETSINDFTIYATHKEEMFVRSRVDEFMLDTMKMLEKYDNILVISLPIACISIILIFIFLIISIGYNKEKEGIDLNDIDKIPIEILIVVSVLLIFILIWFGYVTLDALKEIDIKCIIGIFMAVYFTSYIICMLNFISIIKRIKARVLIKNSIFGRIFRIFKSLFLKVLNYFKKIKDSMFYSGENITLKFLISLLIYVVLSVFLIGLFEAFGLIIVLAIFILKLLKIIMLLNNYQKIENHLKEMYEGNNSKKLEESEFTKEFQNIIKYINNISNGYENAIKEGIKSERLKTELITNVSHDIKTPLTSIINYVDLLKKENIKNEKAKEYIEILDNKSQRLRKLTEDLVEASKASSGNVKLNLETINMVELLKQSIGEYEDKFKEKNLDIITNYSNNKDLFIEADNRYMFRIIENLFSNISKYALDSSRVYIDLIKKDNKAIVIIKNISKERLNISADELMQRFVRGDKSRTTEGSGLGISISKSLTELQKGKFNLEVDGDLFKVELEFSII